MSQWLGRYPLGRQVPLAVRCRNASGAPVAPDSCPAVDIYSSAGKVKSGVLLPVTDPVAAVGLFSLNLFLDASFSPGQYRAVCRWTAAGYYGSEVDTFEVLPGGDVGGPVVGLTNYERPQAVYVPQVTWSGTFRRGKNPRL